MSSDEVLWNVRAVARRKGIKSARQLGAATGLDKNTAGVLLGGRAVRADLVTIGKLCRALDCKPGDLLVLREDFADDAPGDQVELDLDLEDGPALDLGGQQRLELRAA